MYAIVHKKRVNEALARPAVCSLSAVHVTADLGCGRYGPLDDYRVMRLNEGRVELAYTAHEWMREMT